MYPEAVQMGKICREYTYMLLLVLMEMEWGKKDSTLCRIEGWTDQCKLVVLYVIRFCVS